MCVPFEIVLDIHSQVFDTFFHWDVLVVKSVRWKRAGPSTKPWRTPEVTAQVSDTVQCRVTVWVRSFRRRAYLLIV